MPQPTNKQYFNGMLTNILVAYMQSDDDYVHDKVFPVVPVEQQSSYYYTFKKGDWFRTSAQKRAPATESAGSRYNIDKSNKYYCDKWAVHHDVPWDDYSNAKSPLAPDRDATEFVGNQLKLRNEKIFIEKYFKQGLWTGSTSSSDIIPTTLWDASGSTPIEDVDEQRYSIKEKTGKFPNVMIVGPQVFRGLKNHADILGRIKYTQKGLVTKDLLASLFEVDKFLVASAIEDTANEGQDTENMSFMFGKHVLLAYAEKKPGIKKASAGYIFTWKGVTGGKDLGVYINKFEMTKLEANRVEGTSAHDMKLIASDMGVFFANVVS